MSDVGSGGECVRLLRTINQVREAFLKKRYHEELRTPSDPSETRFRKLIIVNYELRGSAASAYCFLLQQELRANGNLVCLVSKLHGPS
jgi:hypothetical protein